MSFSISYTFRCRSIQQTEKHWLQYFVEEIGFNSIGRISIQITHVAIISIEPTFPLHKIQEYDSSHHLLDIVANRLALILILYKTPLHFWIILEKITESFILRFILLKEVLIENLN